MIAPSFGAVYTEHLLYPLWEKKSTVMAPWFRIYRTDIAPKLALFDI